MKRRMLAVLLALPLVAFDCGGKEEPVGGGTDPFGLGCKVRLAGAVAAEEMWCIMTAFDYSAFDPPYGSSTWGFEIVAYRALMPMPEVGAGVGFFLDARPALGVAHGWDGDVASSTLLSGGAERIVPGTFGEQSHSAVSLGAGSGTGRVSVVFTTIPPPTAVDAELLGVHGTVSADLPSLSGGGLATLTATF